MKTEVIMNRYLSFLVGIMIGGLVGATFAMLFAPASGDELRGQIRQRAITLQDDVKTAASARRAELEQQLAALKAPPQGGQF
jgi:gas vesicle protein